MLNNLKIKVGQEELTNSIDCEVLVCYLYQDIRPPKGIIGALDWRLNNLVSKLIRDKKLNGSFGEVSLIATQGKFLIPKFLLLGCGKYSDFNLDKLDLLWKDIVVVIGKMKLLNFGILFEEFLIKIFNVHSYLKIVLENLVGDNHSRALLMEKMILYFLVNGTAKDCYETREYIKTISGKERYNSILEPTEEDEG
ncbi:MAG: M17 family peptidase N-terminal domain-containing protein, partial [bacterium]